MSPKINHFINILKVLWPPFKVISHPNFKHFHQTYLCIINFWSCFKCRIINTIFNVVDNFGFICVTNTWYIFFGCDIWGGGYCRAFWFFRGNAGETWSNTLSIIVWVTALKIYFLSIDHILLAQWWYIHYWSSMLFDVKNTFLIIDSSSLSGLPLGSGRGTLDSNRLFQWYLCLSSKLFCISPNLQINLRSYFLL